MYRFRLCWDCPKPLKEEVVKIRTRTYDVKIRMNDKEYEKFIKQVKKTGLSQQAFLRKLLDGAEIRQQPDVDFFEFIKELQRIHKELVIMCGKTLKDGNIDFKNHLWLAMKKIEQIDAELIMAYVCGALPENWKERESEDNY